MGDGDDGTPFLLFRRARIVFVVMQEIFGEAQLAAVQSLDALAALHLQRRLDRRFGFCCILGGYEKTTFVPFRRSSGPFV